LKTIYIIAIILSLLGIAGTIDYEEQILEEQHYCDMVKAKAWPAYREGVTCK
jgi:hypothetical protein